MLYCLCYELIILTMWHWPPLNLYDLMVDSNASLMARHHLDTCYNLYRFMCYLDTHVDAIFHVGQKILIWDCDLYFMPNCNLYTHLIHQQLYNITMRVSYNLSSSMCQWNVNVDVHVYSPDILVGSADCSIYTPGIGTHSFTHLLWGEFSIQHLSTLLQLQPIITIQLSCSTRYPSLLGGQRRRDMKGLPNASTHNHGHVLSLCESCSRTTTPCHCRA